MHAGAGPKAATLCQNSSKHLAQISRAVVSGLGVHFRPGQPEPEGSEPRDQQGAWLQSH